MCSCPSWRLRGCLPYLELIHTVYSAIFRYTYNHDFKLLIITNGRDDQKKIIRTDFPTVILGCPSSVCSDMNPRFLIALEQELCSYADIFIGCGRSSFAGIINAKRAYAGAQHGFELTPTGVLTNGSQYLQWTLAKWSRCIILHATLLHFTSKYIVYTCIYSI